MTNTHTPHTSECNEIGGLIELVTEQVRATYGRGPVNTELGLAAQALCLAQSHAHRTCITHDLMFSGRA